MGREIPIVYDDPYFVVVAKPSGQLVHALRGETVNRNTTIYRVRGQLRSAVYPVHRLDRGTSGLLIFARSRHVASAFGEAFREGRVQKVYAAIVRGFCEDEGCIRSPLKKRSLRDPGMIKQHEDVMLDSETRYRTIQCFEIPLCSDRYPTTRCSQLQLQPATGRWHQLRRHLNHIAHPILGDTSHGDHRQNRFYRRHFGLSRLMLAATNLTFSHPVTGELISLHRSPAEDFEQFVQQLTSWSIGRG